MDFVTSNVTVDGKAVEVRELSVRNRMELFDLNKKKLNPLKVQAHVLKMGCPECSNMSIDKIMDLPGLACDAISTEILDISGLGSGSEKKAEKK